MRDQRSILDWLADSSYQGESMSGYWDGHALSVHFPDRDDLRKPGETINADLIIHHHPQWPNLDRAIARRSAERVIFTAAIADAIHEIAESITIDGEPVLKAHQETGMDEDDMWDIITDCATQAAIKILKEHPRP